MIAEKSFPVRIRRASGNSGNDIAGFVPHASSWMQAFFTTARQQSVQGAQPTLFCFRTGDLNKEGALANTTP